MRTAFALFAFALLILAACGSDGGTKKASFNGTIDGQKAANQSDEPLPNQFSAKIVDNKLHIWLMPTTTSLIYIVGETDASNQLPGNLNIDEITYAATGVAGTYYSGTIFIGSCPSMNGETFIGKLNNIRVKDQATSAITVINAEFSVTVVNATNPALVCNEGGVIPDDSAGPDQDDMYINVTIDEIPGIWRIDAVDVIQDTCEFPNMDSQSLVGTYNYIEKADETHVNTYNCDTDATCTTKTEMQTFEYSKNKIIVPASQSDIVSSGGCRVYIDIPTAYTVLSSPNEASMVWGGSVKFEGTCDTVKTANAGDDAHPDKTMGDYEGCQIQIKRTMSKQ